MLTCFWSSHSIDVTRPKMQKVAEEGNGTPYFREIRHPMLGKYHYNLARMFSREPQPNLHSPHQFWGMGTTQTLQVSPLHL